MNILWNPRVFDGFIASSGVVLLHLLLVPGAAFCAGGSRMHEQKLDPTHNSLNHSLSMAG